MVAKVCENADCPDIELFGVRGEYAGDITHCPKCGAELVEPKPEPRSEPVPTLDFKPDWLEPIMPSEGDFFFAASFRDLPDAHIARGLLQDAGFFTEILDEYIVGINWLYSQANHGVKLIVKGDNQEEVRALLKTDGKHFLANLPEMSQPPTAYDICPSCESENIGRPRWSKSLKALALLFVWPFLFVPIAAHFEPTRCNECGRRWHPQWAA